ncbi:SIMPL domain-containing protein [Sandaracinobacteroides saxicola]|uniref:SIMPL domain-containing protein n=1 Tax=Sandaracinobacteroides saxicola TaxID=2759707 RepID=A0A7G5IIV4_9SPHN|nr:SIMPL domain-containing protein [Sandaracinobacteroides saxicola]QMW23296.1 SIMPL domain-containing protein [Sandaracinobacteroides saxicola]
MKKMLAAALALAALSPLHAQAAPATLTLSTEARLSAVPDVADIGAGVVTSAKDANAAMTENASRMSAVIAALRKSGVAERDIQTSGLNLQPQYRYGNNVPPVLTGYQANNRVSVTLRDLKGAGRIIDTLVAQGANQIDGPTFRVDKPEALLDQVRQQAIKTLRARADLYATAAGLRIKRITAIAENNNPFTPRPQPMMAMAMRAEKADSPVAPGEIDLSLNVSMTFELE